MATDKQISKFGHMKSVAQGYLIDNEVIHWQGKPATIVIIGRGLALVLLSLAYTIALGLGHDAVAYVAALLACALMMVTDKRYGLIIGIVGIAIIPLVFFFGSSGAMTWLLLVPLIYSLTYLLIHTIYLNRVLFMVTNQRIVTRYGIFSLRYAELDIHRIQNVTVIQPWYERLLGYGDLFYATAGEEGGIDYERPGLKLMSGGAVTWENVAKPFDVVRKVNEIILHSSDSERKDGGLGGSGALPKVPLTSDTEERLRHLSELSTKGLISQQEYQQKRDEILKNL